MRYFLDRYGLNLLAIPRADVSVASLYVSSDGRRVSMPGAIDRFLTPRPRLPKIRQGEAMADLSGTASAAVTFRAGVGLLEGFLTALGGAGMVDNVKAEYQRKRVQSLRFRVTAATRDSVDPGALGDSLQGCRLRVDHPLWAERNRYYVVAGVVRSSSLVVVAHGAENDVVDIDVGALAVAAGSASVGVERVGDGAIRYRGSEPLAFGVELYELVPDREVSMLRLRTPRGYVATRSGGATPASAQEAPMRVFPGGQRGRAFLEE